MVDEITQLVTIVVPVYKCERYIAKCITSILGQSYRNFELILIIDGNFDNSLAICRSFEKKDNRIIVIEQENLGVSVARNVGVKYSHGEWIVFVDSDDWLEKDFLKVMLENTYDCDIVVCGYYADDKESSHPYFFLETNKCIYENEEKKSLIENCIVCNSDGNRSSIANVGVPWAKIYKKSLLVENEIKYVPGLTRMQDMIFNLYAIWYANKIRFIDSYLYHYSLNETASTQGYRKDFDVTAEKIIEEIEKFIYCTKNEYLNDAKRDKTVLLILEMIKLQFCSKQCKQSIFEKANNINKIVFDKKRQFYDNIMNSKKIFLSKKQRIATEMIRNKLTILMLLFINVKSYRNRFKLLK